jgi:hypothetical protein
LVAVYCLWVIGASTLMVTASTTTAQARRGGRGWGGGRGRGRGGVGIYLGGYPAYGYGYSPYYVAPGPSCYWSRRYRRRICRY